MKISTLELGDAVATHPVRTLAIAFAVGAALALAERSRGAIAKTFIAAVSGTALSLAREHLATQARSWIDERRAAAVVH